MQEYKDPALELMYHLLLSIPGDKVEILDFQSKVSHRPGTASMYMTSEAEGHHRGGCALGRLFVKFTVK